MKHKETDSGTVVPVQKRSIPDRQFGVLELQDEDERDTASKALNTLLNIWSVRSRFPGEAAQPKARRALILLTATQLLGDDWSYEELC